MGHDIITQHGAPDLTDLTRPTRHDPTEPQISDTGQPRFFTCQNEWIREWMHGHISTSWSCSFDMLNHFAVVVIQIQCADPFRRRGHAIGPEHVPQHGPRTRPTTWALNTSHTCTSGDFLRNVMMLIEIGHCRDVHDFISSCREGHGHRISLHAQRDFFVFSICACHPCAGAMLNF